MQEIWIALPGLIFWVILFLLPWRPWGIKESLDAQPGLTSDLSDISILIPARNESTTIKRTLISLVHQGNIKKIFLIDDQSTDDTKKNCISS
jgi:cellulose synthase/poly-beta-1,6-N-acetylglucosamine synthase-like glycosyltransferase